MLRQLGLKHFKCFEKLRLPLAPLTLLTGLNASGKSTVLQALVLLHQTMREQEWTTRLALNGGSVRLGTMPDVVDEVFGRRSFELALVEDERRVEWEFGGERRDLSMAVSRVSVAGRTENSPRTLRHLLPEHFATEMQGLVRRLQCLTYITAERLPPQETYELKDPHAVAVVGPRGEHAASILHWGREEGVIEGLALPGGPHDRLREVQKRMATFFPGCAIDLQPVPRVNAVTLGLRTSDATGFHRPGHTGFGLTQCLPIVVATLSAAEEDLILLENPEVHLHPAGQAKMGEFLADVARVGVQVIVETHSDHVLNGVRRAVKSGRLGGDQVAIHFFRPRSDGDPQVSSPAMDKAGNIDHWPKGFFDQFDTDASYFAGWMEEG